MRLVIQRVSQATLSVEGQLVSHIDSGLVVYIGVAVGDTIDMIAPLATKLSKLRIFSDDNGKMNKSVIDTCGQILLVSQFTLLADTSHGNRPSYTGAMQPTVAKDMYLQFGQQLEQLGISVSYGVFGADMTIQQTNCGPVTITIG